MTLKTYRILEKIPFVSIWARRQNYLGFPCSPLIEMLNSNGSMDIIRKWYKEHPNQLFTHKIAAEVFAKARAEGKLE